MTHVNINSRSSASSFFKRFGTLIHKTFESIKDFVERARLFGSKREMRALMVGLDAAGKTTVLYKLKLGTNHYGWVSYINVYGLSGSDPNVVFICLHL